MCKRILFAMSIMGALGCILVACSSSPTVQIPAVSATITHTVVAQVTPTFLSKPTVAPMPSPTPLRIQPDCSNYPVTATSSYKNTDIPLPLGTIVGSAGPAAGTFYQFMCTPQSTQASINTFMATALVTAGWVQLTPQNTPACLQKVQVTRVWKKADVIFEWDFVIPGLEAQVNGIPTWVILGHNIGIFGCLPNA